MKRSLLLVLLVVFLSFSHVFSQVGIGTASPNQKAVLELKSPGNNQGFLVPRLSTVQRTAMTGLAAGDKGLLVFDSDLNKFHYWSGTAWVIIDDSTGTDSQTISFTPATGLLAISGGNNVTLSGVAPGGAAGGDLTGTYPNPTVTNNAVTSSKLQSDPTTDANRAVTTNHVRDNAITSAKIADGTVTDADINASAGIAVTKFSAGSNGQVLTTVGGVPTWNTPSSGGSVTNVATGTGLTGGPITTSGTISIAANGVTATELRSDAVTDANRSVTTNHLRDNSVTSAKIADGVIVTLDLADNAVTSLKIVDGAITSAKILDGTLATVDLADGLVTNLKVATDAITTTKILDGTLATADLADGAVTNLKVATDAITSAKILDGTLATADLATDAVTSAKILDGTLATADLAADAVTSAKILDGTLATADLADGSVTTLKVATDAITSAKILDGTLATADLATDAVTSAKILDGTLATADLAADAVTSAKILDGTLAAADLATGSVTSAKVLDGDLVNADISTTAGIAISKFAAGATGQVMITSGTSPTWSNIGGDLAGSFPNPTIATGAGTNLVAAVNNAATTGTINTARLNTSVVLDTEAPAAGDVNGSFSAGIQIVANAVTNAEILDGTIGTADIAASAVTDAKIATGVDVAKLTAAPTTGFVLTTVLGNVVWAALPVFGSGTVTSVATGTGLTGGPITTTGTISIAANGVTGTELRSDAAIDANRAVTTNHIQDGAVNSAKVLNGSLLNADISASAAVAVTKLAASAANGDVLTTVAGTPTWQAPVDASATNEIQNLSSVLTQGNNAGGAAAVNFSALSVNRADTPGALNVNGSQYVSFTALGAVTSYTVGANDYIIIGTNTAGVITNVTIPDASTNIGRVLILKGRSIGSASAAGLQAVMSGTDTLDGSTNPPILTPVGTSMTTLTIIAISANEWITLNRTHN